MRIVPNKILGQHFLNDLNILNLIADSAQISSVDNVVEIGPGKGSLTRVLADRTKNLTAIEIDSALVNSLREEFKLTVNILHSDARNFEPTDIFESSDEYILVGNLPYYAALPILRRFLESRHPPKRIVVLVQREVAQLLCAQPGSMSIISVAFQIFGKLRIIRNVKPGSFSPPPKVTSSIVSLEVHSEHLSKINNLEEFFNLVKAGFSAPRKQIKNSLSNGLGWEASEVLKLLQDATINPLRRAQTMSIDEWIRLYRSRNST